MKIKAPVLVSKITEERLFVVDSGASLHVLSKKDLRSDEMDTLWRSRTPTTVVTASGEVQTNEETQVYVHDLDLFVTVQLLEETPAGCSQNDELRTSSDEHTLLLVLFLSFPTTEGVDTTDVLSFPTEDGGSHWRNLEGQFGSVKLAKMVSDHLQAAWFKESSLVILIEQEQCCAIPRLELCEAKIGRDRHCAMHGARRTGTTKSQLSRKERGLHCQGLWLKEFPEGGPSRFYVLSADIEARGHTEGFQVLQRWHRMEERTNHTTTNVENERERLLTAP